MERILKFAERIGDRILRIVKNAKFRRYFPLGLVLAIALVTLVTCMPWTQNGSDPDPDPDPPEAAETPPILITQPTLDPDPDPPEETQPPEEPEPPEEPDLRPRNPLTGLPTETDITQNRPLAIMINNHNASLPQVGISQADIIYEIMVEGVTRMLAVFQDVSNAGVIGSVRSARPYYIDIAQGYDAIFVFAGASEQAYSILSSRNITRLDGVHGRQSQLIFYRDPNRASMAFEHRLVTSGERLTENLPDFGFRLEHEQGFEYALSFAEDGTPDGGEPAQEITVNFSSGKSTTFTYDPNDGLYYLRQTIGRNSGPYKDGSDDSQLAVTNVLILQTSISLIPGDRYNRLRVTTTGTGSGYFVCGGQYIDINWSKENEASQFIYTLNDGSELVLGQGKTYICIVSRTSNLSFS